MVFCVEIVVGARVDCLLNGSRYQLSLRMFCDYLIDERYGWVAICVERFGAAPTQILHEWNSVVHVNEFEGQPGRRALTYDEVQTLFDAADAEVEQIRRRARKDSLQALRNAVLLKTVYAFGLRRAETVGLDLSDLRTNPKASDYGRFGGLFVRWAKSSRGSPPKRRTVLTVPEMDWIVGILGHYLEEVRPLFTPGCASRALVDRTVRPDHHPRIERSVRRCP